ncbi:hypothetical protein OKJ48_22440 [Streptomyces kunmingensis]|uniref:Uncharacterized protein n=1 Tax=Streptomyces kunmingensis TaxID=68225 RepID=A0ABU6CF19_9ACTN|nr:hypothetical protein [Streptomyces kunmingensis]MEB3962985.1 hypothetical protein [Streptomyces kunmingensis]
MLLSQSLTDIHETIIILPGGGIHVHGLLYEGPEPLEILIERVCRPLHPVAVNMDRLIRLNIGHPDGHVEQYQMAADGTLHPHQVPDTAPAATDPIWSQGIPQDSGLLGPMRAAHRAGNWRAARQEAHRATQRLIARHGPDHPYAAMGNELQAYFALMDQDRTAGAVLSTASADAIHRLGGPPAQFKHHLANAVAAWLHSDRDTRPGGPGFAVAHALLRITPDDHVPIGVVLKLLTKDRA